MTLQKKINSSVNENLTTTKMKEIINKKIYERRTTMKREFFEEFSFKEEAELINLEYQMQNNQIINKETNIGFNNYYLYNNIDDYSQPKKQN